MFGLSAGWTGFLVGILVGMFLGAIVTLFLVSLARWDRYLEQGEGM